VSMCWVSMRLSCATRCLRGLWIIKAINLCVTTGLCGVGLVLIAEGLVYYIRNSLKTICQSTEIGVEFLLVEIRLLNRVILVGLVYRPPNSSIVYRALESGNYGLDAFEGICSDFLSLYGEVFILGDFNDDLLDPGHVLFEPFSDLLETFMLHNVAILLTSRVSGKLLDLFLVSFLCERFL
jgi:hypothetical protein